MLQNSLCILLVSLSFSYLAYEFIYLNIKKARLKKQNCACGSSCPFGKKL